MSRRREGCLLPIIIIIGISFGLTLVVALANGLRMWISEHPLAFPTFLILGVVAVFLLRRWASRRSEARLMAEEERRRVETEKRLEMAMLAGRQVAKKRLEAEEIARQREAAKRQRLEALLRRDAVPDEINYMSGAEFERFMADLFRQEGYGVEETKATGDQGVDLLLDMEGKRVAVQLKRWTGPVGNAVVGATFAGMAHYEADEGWIITTSTFTKAARELARSTGVRLIDGKELGDWLEGLGEP